MNLISADEIDEWLEPVREQMSTDEYLLFARRVRAADEHADWRPILDEVMGWSELAR